MTHGSFGDLVPERTSFSPAKLLRNSEQPGIQIPAAMFVFISADNMATALTIASLNCLGELFKSCGVFLRKSLHKNVQCILIGLCTEVQAEKGIKTSFLNFKASGARSALYNTLLEVVLGSHPKWPAPTQYALKIFEQGETFSKT